MFSKTIWCKNLSAPRISDGQSPRHRQGLRYGRRRMSLELQPVVFAHLEEMMNVDGNGSRESYIAAIERLIESAHAKKVGAPSERRIS